MMDNVKVIDNTEEAKEQYGYMWGADTFILTKDMIQELQNGKCIAGDNGEYVTFIIME